MSKKKAKTDVVSAPTSESVMTIDMNKINLYKSYIVPNFKTGAHEKKKVRDKNWRKWKDE